MKHIGYWWNDTSIELVELADGGIYALYGWNGEVYTDCWKCESNNLYTAREGRYTLVPVYDDDDNIIDYDVI